jgi:ATP-binding cassette, subfamily B, bacterial
MAKGFKRGNDEVLPTDKRKVSGEGVKKALRIFSFVRPYRAYFITGCVFLVLSTITSLAFPKFIGLIVEVVEKKAVANYNINQVAVGLFGVLLLQGLFSFLRIYLFSRVSELAMADVRRQVYEKIITLPVPFFEQRRVGELTSRISSDVTQMQDILSFTLAEFFRQIATLVIGTILIWYTSWKLTIFMLATFPVLIIAALIFGKHIRTLSKKSQDALADTNVIVEETLQSVNVVKAFTNEPLEAKRYGLALDKVVANALKAATFRGGFVSFIIFALFGGIVGVVWYGAGLVQQGEMSIADLITFVLYTTFIGGAVGGMGDIYAQIQKTIGASERLLEILGEKSEVTLTSVTPTMAIEGAISFREVQFTYPSRPDMPVLKNITLNVAAGQKIALVGYSGAGKSTIVQLLMRYHLPSGGQILVDNTDIQALNITAYRQHMAVVPQEVMLFGGTIYENIGYGKPTATAAEIAEAARKANALEFIESFPEGFQTIVGERGVKLSGGQRQRVAIARAILKDPKILILDEATSSLDAESERLVQEALDRLMENRTTIIIAHRLATVRNVDCIYVLKDGAILESGTHEQLAERTDGLYAGLVKLQFETETPLISN